MNKKFSKFWKASKQPKKQRKYLANIPMHLVKKKLNVNLAKELRKKYGKRKIPLRKGDIVKIMRGKYKKQKGKITKILRSVGKIYVENIQIKKIEGSKVDVPLKASNLQIIELNLEDKKRNKFLKQEKKIIKQGEQ